MSVSIYIDAQDKEVSIYRSVPPSEGEQMSIEPRFEEMTVRKPRKRDLMYRLNVAIRPEFRFYLAEMAYRHRTTLTEYINMVLDADMEKHPDWKEHRNEVNKDEIH